MMAEKEERLDRQRRKFSITLIPTANPHRAVILDPLDGKEEKDNFTGQQLCKQERDSSLDQEKENVSRVREEEEGQLELKQEADNFVVTPTYEENDREHFLPHNAFKTESQNPRADVPQLHDYKEKEEVLTLQKLCNQEKNLSLDREEQDAAQVKVEHEDHQLELKQETDSFMVTPTYEETEPDREQCLYHNSSGIEIQDQKAVILDPHDWKEEEEEDDFTDQQLCKQERDPSLDQEELKVSQVKEEELWPWPSCEEEQPELKQEPDTFMVTHTPQLHDYKDDDEEEVLIFQQLCNQGTKFSLDQEEQDPTQVKQETEEQLGLKQETDFFMITTAYEKNDQSQMESNMEQLFCYNSSKTENHNQKAGNHVNLGLNNNDPMAEEGEKRYPCEICGKSFNGRFFLTQHLRIHTGEKPYCCETCGKTFTIAASLSIHMRTHTGEKPYSCKTCGKHFSQKSHLSRHMGIHSGVTPYSCEICGKSFGRSSYLDQHMATHTDVKPYSCKICGKGFSRGNYLKIHLRSHTGEKLYFCETCGKSFSSAQHLKIHLRIHTSEKLHSCQVCGNMFKTPYALGTHMRTHTGEKPYSCKTCGKHFSQTSHLSRHMGIHTGVKPYSCETCGKSFISSDKLARHEETHKGLKPFSCETCEQRFATHQSLKAHMRIHTDDKSYTCKTCAESFTNRTTLTCHMRTHTGEKLHSCDSCGKCFTYNCYLRKHMQIHSGEKPYSCEICEKSFNERSGLVDHMATHKDLEPLSEASTVVSIDLSFQQL